MYIKLHIYMHISMYVYRCIHIHVAAQRGRGQLPRPDALLQARGTHRYRKIDR